jgi:hypothetical protein
MMPVCDDSKHRIAGDRTPQPAEMFQRRIRLSSAINKIKNVTFIRATEFVEGSPVDPFYGKAKAKSWKTLAIPCSHDVILDLPQELTAILVSL